ncbi:hypothetical protein RAS1_19500 [Phycisphaerae bacterium RAS1]|nr:hypothetical protein RAS1_19500 [Phycisphaerae bacterium RAS1]
MKSHFVRAMWGAAVAMSWGTAYATNFTFAVTSGDWNNANNWTPPTGPPSQNDQATIPSGKTCLVTQTGHQIAKLVVEEGGVVGMVGGTLEVLPPPPYLQNPLIIVHGTLYFK